MAYQFQYFDEALNDIQEAKLWYKEQRNSLEVEFAKAIEEAIEQIIKIPLILFVIKTSVLLILNGFHTTFIFILTDPIHL